MLPIWRGRKGRQGSIDHVAGRKIRFFHQPVFTQDFTSLGKPGTERRRRFKVAIVAIGHQVAGRGCRRPRKQACAGDQTQSQEYGRETFRFHKSSDAARWVAHSHRAARSRPPVIVYWTQGGCILAKSAADHRSPFSLTDPLTHAPGEKYLAMVVDFRRAPLEAFASGKCLRRTKV